LKVETSDAGKALVGAATLSQDFALFCGWAAGDPIRLSHRNVSIKKEEPNEIFIGAAAGTQTAGGQILGLIDQEVSHRGSPLQGEGIAVCSASELKAAQAQELLTEHPC
jgi:hypothetical protein